MSLASYVSNRRKSTQIISTFGGINENIVASGNEFSMTTNMSTDNYPYSATSYTGLLNQNGKLVSTDLSQMLPQEIGVVDLGTLNWNRGQSTQTEYYNFSSSTVISDAIYPSTNYEIGHVLCGIYTNTYDLGIYRGISNDKTISLSTTGLVRVRNDTYTDAQSFKSAMSGVLLFYKKATT